MYQLSSLLAVVPSLLLCFLAAPTSHAHALQFNQPPVPQYLLRPQDSRPLLTRWRDRAIKALWGIPHTNCDTKLPKKQSASKISPPPSLLARYGGDMVLRFKISSREEAESLANGIDTLMLDVWEFTTDWVDIRLSKDVVSLTLSLSQRPIPHHCIPGSSSPRLAAFLTAECPYASNA